METVNDVFHTRTNASISDAASRTAGELAASRKLTTNTDELPRIPQPGEQKPESEV